jgi:SAM-dependent methyltransferase
MKLFNLKKNKTSVPLLIPDFDQDLFIPAVYNSTYYSQVMADELELIKWQSGELRDVLSKDLLKKGKARYDTLLDIGCGPAIHHMISLAPLADKIKLADYMPENLAEIRRWQRRHPRSHDWKVFTQETLKREGFETSSANIRARQNEVRAKIKSLHILDLKQPVDDYLIESADFVTSFFVSDSATKSKKVFHKMVKNVFSTVTPGGVFVSAYLGACQRYKVGKHWINSADITEDDLKTTLGQIGAREVKIWRFDTPHMQDEGFDHIFAAVAFK